MPRIKFNRQDIFKKLITINGVRYQSFNILDIPKNFGCITTEDGKDGIKNYINYKGLTYYKI
jgi:hypothetical protein